MADDFPLQLKSTIDKLVADKVAQLQAEYPTLQWAEVDDLAGTDAVFKSAEPAVVWQWGNLTERPRAPMYAADFTVAVKTVADPGNYLLIRLLGEIRDVFAPGTTYQVFDYTMPATDPADITARGYITITSNEIMEQGFDRQSGVRPALISARAVRYG